MKSFLLVLSLLLVITWQSNGPVYQVTNMYQGIFGLPKDLRIQICSSPLVQAIDYRHIKPVTIASWISLIISFYLGDWEGVWRSAVGIYLSAMAALLLIECERITEILPDDPVIRANLQHFYVARRIV